MCRGNPRSFWSAHQGLTWLPRPSHPSPRDTPIMSGFPQTGATGLHARITVARIHGHARPGTTAKQSAYRPSLPTSPGRRGTPISCGRGITHGSGVPTNACGCGLLTCVLFCPLTCMFSCCWPNAGHCEEDCMITTAVRESRVGSSESQHVMKAVMHGYFADMRSTGMRPW